MSEHFRDRVGSSSDPHLQQQPHNASTITIRNLTHLLQQFNQTANAEDMSAENEPESRHLYGSATNSHHGSGNGLNLRGTPLGQSHYDQRGPRLFAHGLITPGLSLDSSQIVDQGLAYLMNNANLPTSTLEPQTFRRTSHISNQSNNTQR